jgi:hypothetical protein
MNLCALLTMQCGGFSVSDSHAFNRAAIRERRMRSGNNKLRWKASVEVDLLSLRIRHCADGYLCLVYASISVVDAIAFLLKN